MKTVPVRQFISSWRPLLTILAVMSLLPGAAAAASDWSPTRPTVTDFSDANMRRDGARGIANIAMDAPALLAKVDVLSENASAGGSIRRIDKAPSGALAIDPAEGARALRVSMPLDALVLPSRHVDDIVLTPGEHGGRTLCLVDENLLVGLAGGGRHMVIMAWPQGDRRVEASLSREGDSSIAIEFDGRPVYLRTISGENLWTRVPVPDDRIGEAMRIDWTPPFKAHWTVQALEDGVPTTYKLSKSDGRIFRPGIGQVIRPGRFTDDGVVLHFSKRLPPYNGEAWIYAMEGHADTPYIVLRNALDPKRQAEVDELHKTESTYANFRHGIPAVWHTACGGRDRLRETTLKTGAQARTAPFVASYAVDRVNVATIAELQHRRYAEFMDRMDVLFGRWIAEAEDPEAKNFLRDMKASLPEMRELFHRRMDGETAAQKIETVKRLGERFAELAREPGEEVYPEIRLVLNRLNGSLSRQEGLGRRFGTAARTLFRRATIDAMNTPGATPYAEAIRKEVRRLLSRRRWERPGGRPSSLIRTK